MSQDFVDDGLVDLPMIIGVFVVDFFELFLPDSHDCAEGLSEGGHLSGFFIKGSLKLHDLIKLIIFESLGAVVGLLELVDFVEELSSLVLPFFLSGLEISYSCL